MKDTTVSDEDLVYYWTQQLPEGHKTPPPTLDRGETECVSCLHLGCPSMETGELPSKVMVQ